MSADRWRVFEVRDGIATPYSPGARADVMVDLDSWLDRPEQRYV